MSERSAALAYAVRLRVIGKLFGQLSLALAVLTGVPFLVSLGFADFGMSLRLGTVVAVLLLLSLMARMRAPSKIQNNEAMVLSALIFLLTPILMAWPLQSEAPSTADAFFEAVSAATTTGLSTLGTTEDKSAAFLFFRSWIQWYGGLGIVILSLAVMIRPGQAAKQLAMDNADRDDLTGGTKSYARQVLTIYGGLTLIGLAVVWIAGAPFFDALLLVFCAVSTAGFSPDDASLAALDSYVSQAGVMALCVAGAVPFFYYLRLKREKWAALSLSREVWLMMGVGLIPPVLVILCMSVSGSVTWPAALWHGVMQSASAQTTAGFSTMPGSELDAGSKFVMIASMMIGGGAGSTAGGIKVLRLLILIHALIQLVRSIELSPHAVSHARLGRERLEADDIQRALCVVLLFVGLVFVSWIPFVVLGYDPLDSLFEVVSATGTVGLSSGITGPELPVFLKGVLCADMLLGRLEIVAWLVLFAPLTWSGERQYASV